MSGPATTVSATNAKSPSSSDGGSGGNAVAIAALILGGFAVLVALLAVWSGRPRSGQRDQSEVEPAR
jgi:hypothetical protein